MGTQETLARLAMAKMARVDPVPYDPRTGQEYELLRVEIESTTENQAIPNGQIVKAGIGPYEIYANQLAAVEALVERATDDERQRVQDDYERHCAECRGEHGDARNERTYEPSYQASFRRLMHRDPLPFARVEVLHAPVRRKAASE